MIDINTILENVEDKFQNISTTSKKFKLDLFDFCLRNGLTGTAIEYGTHKGQTTAILSLLFDYVITVNLPGHFDEAKRLNANISNIEYVGLNLYGGETKRLTNEPVTLFFSDAVHSYSAVQTDIKRSILHNRPENSYIVFDDYGMYDEVRRSVDDAIYTERILDIVQYIGYQVGTEFAKNKKLAHYEGIICKIK